MKTTEKIKEYLSLKTREEKRKYSQNMNLELIRKIDSFCKQKEIIVHAANVKTVLLPASKWKEARKLLYKKYCTLASFCENYGFKEYDLIGVLENRPMSTASQVLRALQIEQVINFKHIKNYWLFQITPTEEKANA